MGFSKARLIIIICLTPLIYFAWLCISKTALNDMKIKTVKVQTEKNTLCGLVDSGNLLTEPQSGLCVIVANRSSFGAEIPLDCLQIKVHTASGDAYLPCFKPKYLKIGNKEVDAMIALNEQDKLDYDCIVPISLID